MCNYLVAKKYGKIISKTPVSDEMITEDFNGELAKVYIRKEYIGEEERKAFEEWYEKANWYGYDSRDKAMARLDRTGDFKEEVLPEEICGWFGNIEIDVEIAA